MYVCQPSHTHARLVCSLVLVGIRFLVEAEAEENPGMCGGEGRSGCAQCAAVFGGSGNLILRRRTREAFMLYDKYDVTSRV